jgi:capsular exopolysaccharide synthesis family protein
VSDITHSELSGAARLLPVLRRQWAVLLVCVVVLPGTALCVSLLRTPLYESSVSLLFRDPGFDEKLFGNGVLLPSDDDTRQAATNLELVSLPIVAMRTARALGGDITADDIRDRLRIEQRGDSNLVRIAVRDPDPDRAARIANAFARTCIGFRRDADRLKIRETIELVRRRLEAMPSSAASASLAPRLQELEILESLQTGNVEIAEPAIAANVPVAPRPVRNTAFGLLLGLLLGAGLALLREQLDRRIRTAHEASELIGRPLLASIPAFHGRQARELGLGHLPRERLEDFRLLRAGLLFFNLDRAVRSVLVTSPGPGDGKSTTAWNLAIVAGTTGDRVLLIEADLRRPALTERHRLVAESVGLSGVLVGQADIEDAVLTVALEPPEPAAQAGGCLQVLPAGRLPPNPTDLLELSRMRELLIEAEQDYDLVVIDTPPASIVSDPIPLLSAVSGVIVVVRVGRTTRDAVSSLRRVLENSGATTLGVVANGIAKPEIRYDDAYASAYRDPHRRGEASRRA